jgi:hypothetical protein
VRLRLTRCFQKRMAYLSIIEDMTGARCARISGLMAREKFWLRPARSSKMPLGFSIEFMYLRQPEAMTFATTS